ncbi:membrane protein [Bacillus coahuilensis m2-6]|uniref:DUF421 domain-containing protein n=1 Tax=Bacillus coahuilensis TaxID=408580 RepID=UPI00075042D6|nr:DUF421 domain-containing protein [Bacillus coahuilensis]KUP06935.1 membrane protein [Bacillus coahuilensis m2-6]
MEEYAFIIFRTIFLYFVITIIFRLMGKREIGELSILDLVVFIMIAELAVVAIEDTSTPLFDALLPMIILMVVQILLAFVSLKIKKCRELLDGKPTIIINNGKIDEDMMRRQRYNFDDLLLQLREKDIRNIDEVEYAILETSGKLSVIKKSQKKKDEGYTLPLILDGDIQMDHLESIGKDDWWLRKELRERGYRDLSAISFCSYQNGYFYIDLKES